MKKKRNYQLVEVRWIDSASETGWRAHEEAKREPLTCWSAGYLVHRDRKSLVIALNSGCEDSRSSFGDAITIPAKCVQSVRKLK